MELRLIFLSWCVCLTGVLSQTKRKNVLVFLADDGGFLQSAYNNTVCNTPNLDWLASRSVVFENGYTSVSSCSPSRSVLLSGLPQHQNGMYGLHQGIEHFNSFDGVRSLPVILSGNGIRTGLIGKKHVGPDAVYKFDYERSNEQYSMNQIARNITFMKGFVQEFLQQEDDKPFFLYIAFHDTHRGPANSKYGPFMNLWGTGQPGMGGIPDWTPHFYDPSEVVVPYFLPDTPATRKDISAMYTSFTRMDQGIGLFMSELKEAGYLDDTLILFTSDNGIPFPVGKTNLYAPGQGVPMMISSPQHRASWGKVSDALTNTMDFVPTILDWFNVSYPDYKLNSHRPTLTGHSLLSLLNKSEELVPTFSTTYSSHNLHEVTMYYPMRVARSGHYRLIHNLNNEAPYPIGSGVFTSPTFQDILNRSRHGVATHWFKTLHQYYYRPEWELFDLTDDPHEMKNLAYNATFKTIFHQLKEKLVDWQWKSADPWVCLPHQHRVGPKKCQDLYNG